MKTKHLHVLAGAVWTAVGLMLMLRGGALLRQAALEGASALALVASGLAGLALGAAKGHYVLASTARRNKRRIGGLDRPRPWHVFRPGFYPLIALMIGLGVVLRRGAAAGWFGGYSVVGAIYVGIGAALLASATVYFRPDPPPVRTRSDHPPPPSTAPIGLLLVNLGTPAAPNTRAVRRYLREFLSDPRVVEVPRPLWLVILNLFVLPLRAARSARAYRKVWSERGSPLLEHSALAAEALARRLGPAWHVALGMRYGKPSLRRALEELRLAGANQIRVLPLFPQYSNTTTGSVQARVAELVTASRDQPALSFLPPYPDDAGYIEALAQRIEEVRAERPVDFHVFSFHGLPEAYVRAGDPYLAQCTRTSWALAARLGLAREEWEMAFQSRFGKEPWLEPALDQLVLGLIPRYRRVLVSLPGFSADCLETLEEVGLALRLQVEAAGGELVVVPALNEHPAWIEALAHLASGVRERVRISAQVGRAPHVLDS